MTSEPYQDPQPQGCADRDTEPVAKKVSKASTAKKKAAPKKTAGSKKKVVAKKSTSKKKSTAKKKASAKKATSKKTTSKKATSKKTTSKKTAAKKKATPKKKVTAKKPASKKKKAPGKTPSATPTAKRGKRRTVLEAAVEAESDKDGYIIIRGRRVRRIAVDATQVTKRKKSTSKKAAASTKQPRRAKSRLKPEDVEIFRTLLIDKRRSVLSALDSMETEALRSEGSESSSMPIHMADVGSDAYEQDLKLGISASERERISEIDAALQRIVDGTYGVCEVSGKAIKKARLRAKPWARWTIDTARENERTGRRR
jgi:RNA polymerase-binding transcription factor DksA